MNKNSQDIQLQIKTIAMENGVEEAAASKIAQKCYDEVSWRPFGGATSFKELDAQEAAENYAYKVNDENFKLRAIVGNITENSDMDAGSKARAIQEAANEFQNRVEGISLEKKSFWQQIKAAFTSKEAEEDLPEDEPVVALSKGSMTIFQDKATGVYRWLATSSNAFEDLEKELFSTKALEEAVEYADKTGERGPLMFFHIPGTEIGTCDFQGVAGRFLIESGTFDNTPLGRKAVEVFSNSDEDFQVSIGYKYIDGDEKDGTYDWLRFRERSVCPPGTAANPFTSFKVTGEETVNPTQIAQFEKYFGKDMVSQVISRAEEATKELEATVRFKALDVDAFAKEYAEKAGIDPEQAAAIAKGIAAATGVATATVTPVTDTTSTTGGSVTVTVTGEEAKTVETKEEEDKKSLELATLLATMSESLTTLTDKFTTLESEVKALKVSDDEKVAATIAPRMAATRPTESVENVLDAEAAAKIVADNKVNENLDPARMWAMDLIGQKSN